MRKRASGHRGPAQGYAGLSRLNRLGVAALLGAFASLGQAPFDQPIFMVVGFSLAFIVLRGETRGRDAALMGGALGVGYFGVALFWIMEPFQIDPDRHAWMAPFALILMSAGMALFWGGAFWLARLLSRDTWPLILTWTAAEVLRAYLFTGFPWASPAQALVSGTAGQGLALVGPHGMTLWLMSLCWALSSVAGRWRHGLVLTGKVVLFCTAAILLYLPPLAPAATLTAHWVRLVQPNAAQHLKWQPDFALTFFERQLDFTAAPIKAGTPAPVLTIWPETAIPWTLDQAEPALAQIAAVAQGQPVVLGLLRRADEGLFNALAVLDAVGNPAQIYDKHHLVPFGEYIPFGRLLGRFGITGLAQTSAIGFASGQGPRLLDFGPLGKGLPLICYEAVFAHGVAGTDTRPDFLLQITNDAWFGQNAGPQQHLAQARMRAIEQGLPFMRAANTGISAMIDPQGRILASLPMDRAGFLDAPLPVAAPPTPYSRFGDIPVFILLFLGIVAAAVTRHRQKN
ncbi:Apolipoprotein N-acyltransferase [Roseobacter fucihabitans]|uniref:Apolipoprotein N-acyltransferase n=1 Tax=Roseobacter fucihabitans TaxID=1537242 RepID=A0ABZ2BWB4_9RHOB|nr:apolipoprotein N-acyltransferase [Roseobacter litoralis]MBC6965008.1 Apolipoprotein N-acyltransferase [Roseobacter litoralis]